MRSLGEAPSSQLPAALGPLRQNQAVLLSSLTLFSLFSFSLLLFAYLSLLSIVLLNQVNCNYLPLTLFSFHLSYLFLIFLALLSSLTLLSLFLFHFFSHFPFHFCSLFPTTFNILFFQIKQRLGYILFDYLLSFSLFLFIWSLLILLYVSGPLISFYFYLLKFSLFLFFSSLLLLFSSVCILSSLSFLFLSYLINLLPPCVSLLPSLFFLSLLSVLLHVYNLLFSSPTYRCVAVNFHPHWTMVGPWCPPVWKTIGRNFIQWLLCKHICDSFIKCTLSTISMSPWSIWLKSQYFSRDDGVYIGKGKESDAHVQGLVKRGQGHGPPLPSSTLAFPSSVWCGESLKVA